MTNDGEPVIQRSSEDHVTETERVSLGTRHNGNLFCYLLGLSSLVIMTQQWIERRTSRPARFQLLSSRSSDVQVFQKRARLGFTVSIIHLHWIHSGAPGDNNYSLFRLQRPKIRIIYKKRAVKQDEQAP
jgi:hypothetical protein